MRGFRTILAGALAGALAITVTADAGLAADKPAKELFGHKDGPAALKARAIGFYARGCLAGGVALPVDGPAWQAMRLSRNRNWGHPDLVRLVERLATESKKEDGWPGLLIGDLAQPRGGPMLSGHRSHQVGLDADIWLMPMPDRKLSREEREEMSAVSMIKDVDQINPDVWKPGHVKLIGRAASYKEVARIFVHPAIKKALCEATGAKAPWLYKVRPYWGHHYHMHIRINCPPGSDNCRNQPAPARDPGCGKVLDDWFVLLRKPKKPGKPKPRKEIMMSQLPAACRAVLEADGPDEKGQGEPQAAPSTAVPLPTAKPKAEAGEPESAPDEKPVKASMLMQRQVAQVQAQPPETQPAPPPMTPPQAAPQMQMQPPPQPQARPAPAPQPPGPPAAKPKKAASTPQMPPASVPMPDAKPASFGQQEKLDTSQPRRKAIPGRQAEPKKAEPSASARAVREPQPNTDPGLPWLRPAPPDPDGAASGGQAPPPRPQ